MKLKKIIPIALASVLLLTACSDPDPADLDWEPPTKATQQTQPADPTDPTEPEPTVPTEPQPTEPTPTDPTEPEPTDPTEPEPTDPTEPEVEFNPDDGEHTHRFGSWITEQKATCTRLGRKRRYCDCGEVEVKSYIEDHQYGQWTAKKEPTCTEHGENVRYCATCGVEDKTINPMLGHDELVTPGIPATCTDAGVTDYIVCARCEAVLQEATVIEAGHTLVIEEAIEPSCGVEGRTQGSYCSVCQEVFEVSQVLPALTHAIETLFGQDPTCREYGWTEYDACFHCGMVITPAETLDRLGHELVEGGCAQCGHTCDHGVDPQDPGKPGTLEKAEGEPQAIEGTDKFSQKVVCQQCAEESYVVVDAPEEAL